MNRYPTLDLPEGILATGKIPAIDEASRNLAWLVSIVDERIGVLSSYFSADTAGEPDQVLQDISQIDERIGN